METHFPFAPDVGVREASFGDATDAMIDLTFNSSGTRLCFQPWSSILSPADNSRVSMLCHPFSRRRASIHLRAMLLPLSLRKERTAVVGEDGGIWGRNKGSRGGRSKGQTPESSPRKYMCIS